jgi:D-alanine-D-alanine ligase
MKPSNKIRVAVLYGGRSAEHEISLRSATHVIEHLDRSRFEVIPIGIDQRGNWFLGQDIFTKSLEHQTVPLLQEDHGAWFTPEWMNKSVLRQQVSTSDTIYLFDVVFPVVHGTFCEDGTLQGLLELADLPYVGCGVLASAIGMDKDVAKRLASHAGIAVVPYIVIKQEQWQKHAPLFMEQITTQLNYPVFVKPANAGSSIGIQKVNTPHELVPALMAAFQFDTKVLVEKALNAIELELAVLESLESGADPLVSVVGEIKSRHAFYSYAAKYLDHEGAELFIPAPYTEAVQKQARTIAKEIFITLACEGMARVDLFLDRETQQIYFNEVNTIPGFTPISMYPKLMIASGFSYPDLLTHLIQLAMKRHEIKRRLVRHYLG